MAKIDKEIQNKLATLRTEYAKKLNNIIAEIEVTWSQRKLSDLYRMVHNLKGTSATYGYNKISQVARELENLIQPLIGKSLSLCETQHIDALIKKLKTTQSL
jgi:chemotaxis protein histidine kinase CheA